MHLAQVTINVVITIVMSIPVYVRIVCILTRN